MKDSKKTTFTAIVVWLVLFPITTCSSIKAGHATEAQEHPADEHVLGVTHAEARVQELGIGQAERGGPGDQGNHGGGHHGEEGHGAIHLASWRWSEYNFQMMFTIMIVCVAVFKIIFHHLPWLNRILPESCVLIVVGLIAAVLIKYVILDDILHVDESANHPFPKFTSDLFFNVLLPPIILDSALALYDRDFFDNFASVMIFAVFGTLFNVFAIGYSLYGLSYFELLGEFTTVNAATNMTESHQLKATECLIFSSLISAVDPVAVLAIFEEIQVNQGLYFMVFGESLFNDGVTVVLYNTMNTLLQVPKIGVLEGVMAVLAFFCVAFGGALIGFFYGLFASYMTKFTKHVRVMEPLMFFSVAYLAFLSAELVHWSGIISIIGYGICVKRYGFPNFSSESYTTVKYAIKTLASTSDCIIFLFLGMVVIQENHQFHVGFICATIGLCLLFRFIGVFLLSALVNLRRVHRIESREQFIMAYGGLRGAVGFSLAVVLKSDLWYRDLFVTAALAMVFFTVFLQGSTIKLFVKCLDIRLNKGMDDLLTVEINCSMIDDVMDGLEVIVGRKTKAKGLLTSSASTIDKSLKDMLGMEEHKDLLRKYEKIMLDEHFTNLYAPRIIAQRETETLALDNGLANKEETQVALRPFSILDTKKSFREGLRNSNWEKFRNHVNTEEPANKWVEVRKQLEMRRERVKSMEEKILTPEMRRKISTEESPSPSDLAKNGGQANQSSSQSEDTPEAASAGGRSATANWASLRRASKRAVAVKREYDKARQDTARQNVLRALSTEERITEESEEAREGLLRPRSPAPGKKVSYSHTFR